MWVSKKKSPLSNFYTSGIQQHFKEKIIIINFKIPARWDSMFLRENETVSSDVYWRELFQLYNKIFITTGHPNIKYWHLVEISALLGNPLNINIGCSPQE